jgi:hypothetical protein
MSAATLDKRLQALEENNVCRIGTLADYALWRANPNRDPNPEFSSVMRECLESFRTYTMEKVKRGEKPRGGVAANLALAEVRNEFEPIISETTAKLEAARAIVEKYKMRPSQ